MVRPVMATGLLLPALRSASVPVLMPLDGSVTLTTSPAITEVVSTVAPATLTATVVVPS